MKTLKTLFTVGCLIFLAQGVQAQFNLGAGLAISDDIGLFGRAEYEIDETWRAAGTFTFYFDDLINISVLDLDAHYTFLEETDFEAYALGGINIGFLSYDDDLFLDDFNDTEFGINLGGGFRYFLNDSVHPFGEIKLDIGGYEDFALKLGVVFPL